MADNVILASGTAAAQSEAFRVVNTPVTVYAYPQANLAAGEYLDLQYKDPDGNWSDVHDADGQVRLNSARTHITITGRGTYRIDRDLHSSAAGVAVADTL